MSTFRRCGVLGFVLICIVAAVVLGVAHSYLDWARFAGLKKSFHLYYQFPGMIFSLVIKVLSADLF